VLAPTSVSDTFATTVDAFNIAEGHQTPVIVLSDADIVFYRDPSPPPTYEQLVSPLDVRLQVRLVRSSTGQGLGAAGRPEHAAILFLFGPSSSNPKVQASSRKSLRPS
jgi:hypothetical protein